MSKNRYLLIFLINLQCLAIKKLPSGITELLTRVAIDEKTHAEMISVRDSLIEEVQRLQEAETKYSKLRFQVIRTGAKSPTPCPERTVLLKALYAKLTDLNQVIELNEYKYECSKCKRMLRSTEHNCQNDAASSSASFVSEYNTSVATPPESPCEDDAEFQMPTMESPEAPVRLLKPSDLRMSVSRPKPPSAPSEKLSELTKELVRSAIRRNRSMPEISSVKEKRPTRIKPITRSHLNNEPK